MRTWLKLSCLWKKKMTVFSSRSADQKVWGSIPHVESEIFPRPTLVTRRKKSIFLYFLTEIKAFYLSYFIFSSVTKLSNTKHTGNAFQQIYRFSLREIYHITSIIRNSSPKVCWSLDETGSQIFQNSPLLLSMKRLLGKLFLLIWMGISPFQTLTPTSSISSGFP